MRATAHHRRALIIALAAWLVLMMNPFDIEKSTEEKAKEVVSSIIAAFYSASNQVTVVLIDQDFIDADPHRTWPLQYSEQGRLLRKIVAGKPESIFIDLLYKNPHHAERREGGPEIGTSDATAQDNPADLFAPLVADVPPIFIAGLPYEHDRDVGTEGWDCASSRKVLVDSSSILQPIRSNLLITPEPDASGHINEHIGMVAWSGCKDRYPLLLGNNADAPTPAYALFRDHCRRLESRGKPTLKLCHAKELEPMVVTWGAFAPKDQRRFYLPGVCQDMEAQDPLSRIYIATRQYLLGIVDGGRTHRPLNDRLPCPAVKVIPARILMSLGSDALLDALQGQFVFIGANVPGVPDTIVSPVHGQIPGVAWHAMALDNLLRLDDGYVVESRTEDWKLFGLVMLCAFALLGVIRLPAAWRVPSLDPLYAPFGALFCVLCAGYAFALGNGVKTLMLVGFACAASWLAPKKTGEVVCHTTFVCLMTILTVYVLHEQAANWISLSLACVSVNQLVRRRLAQDIKHELEEQTVVTALPGPPHLLTQQIRVRLKRALSFSRTGVSS